MKDDKKMDNNNLRTIDVSKDLYLENADTPGVFYLKSKFGSTSAQKVAIEDNEIDHLIEALLEAKDRQW